MEGQGTTNQGMWMPPILPYVKLVFGFSIDDCLALVQDKDVWCTHIPLFSKTLEATLEAQGIKDKVICQPPTKDFESMVDKLRELGDEKLRYALQLKDLEAKMADKKKREEMEEMYKTLQSKISLLENEISQIKAKIVWEVEEAKKKAQSRVYDKLFDLIIASYLAVANISDDEKQKVKVAWNSAVELLRSLPTSIPISIPQGFLVLRLVPTYIYSFVVELYTRFNTELLSSYYSSLGNYFSKFDRSFLASCLAMTGGVVPFNEAIQAMLQDLVISVAPRRDP